jgi:hypothetical protein
MWYEVAMRKRRDDENESVATRGFRAPGDRRPPSADLPATKRVFLRRRPPTVKPAPMPEHIEERPFFVPPRPPTSHDRYLTYDFKGRLITHTTYRAPPSKPIVPIVGKKKKKD